MCAIEGYFLENIPLCVSYSIRMKAGSSFISQKKTYHEADALRKNVILDNHRYSMQIVGD